QATSKHFVVYANSSLSELQQRAEQLELFDSVFRYFKSLPQREEDGSNKVTVYVVADDEAVKRLFGKGGNNVAGFYHGRASGSVAFTPGRGPNDHDINLLQPQIVLLHEYAHHLMLGNFAGAYPAWFTEGYAEFLSTTRFDKDAVW